MWFVIFGIVLIAAVAAVLYLINRFEKLEIVKMIAKDKKYLSKLIAAGALAILSAVLILTLNIMNAIICVLHLSVIWIICDLVGLIIRKVRKKSPKSYYGGAAAIGITAVYLFIGWFLAHHVFTTNYTVKTDKSIAPLRIVQFADSHIGSTFNADKFSEYIQKIESENPDIVLITGDFVDDGTSREDMLNACKALSQLNTTYGVYFSYGNHDKGYSDAESRGWTASELEAALEENGVTVLEDEMLPIGDDYCLIGRRDISESSRMAMKDFAFSKLYPNRFCIVLDHQPSDYDEQAESGVDLVLSGHTHGGQLIPITYVGEWIGANCRTYGYEKRGDTSFIVTSGISDWSIRFKTGCKSEYAVIDIEN